MTVSSVIILTLTVFEYYDKVTGLIGTILGTAGEAR